MSPKQARVLQGAAIRRKKYDEDSDSELSDIEDDEVTTPAGAPTQQDEESDDDEEEEEEKEEEEEDDGEEDEDESDSSEDDVEESYVSDEPASDDDDSDMKAKPSAKRGAQRAVARGTAATTAAGRRAPAAKPAAVSKKPAPKKATTKQTMQTTTTPNRTGAPTIKLKIGKDRLRQVTSSWTPPPDAGGRSSAAAKSGPTSAPRGRKVIQSDEDEDDEDESKMDEDEQPEPDDELGDEDAEGETDDEMMDSEDDGTTPGTDFMSRTGTPDLSRLTNRQRTRLGEITTADLLELPSGYEKPGANKGITLSAHEQELKRAEMARRRKNLTDQKLEEEKMDTINRLLKKQTPKMRTKGRATGDATPADQDTVMGGTEQPVPPTPTMVRWVSNKDGCRLAVPSSWLTGPLGKQFEPQQETERMRNVRRKLVEEL
ncbi:PAPA-1-like conserved region-domain-containing protein [Sphaerosporella brunnea]|uniref:PAPA-1-like conserved region-domain-containing protein n=1 Tax=Sphaerosporella brunnea TaxID=1250544 RepID=A0A5J5ES83_9PEZI|nr:PAPA-1-like conserved region-domain-containing protein [Sphaerosporella brunnea]